MVKCEQKIVYLPCQNCVFYRTEIHGTVLKQPIRVEYLIKQKPQAALSGKQECTEGSDRTAR